MIAPSPPAPPGKFANLGLITIAQVLALVLWFAGTAAGPGMMREAGSIGSSFQAWLTGAVQVGFVAGTLVSAVLALSDRYDPRLVFAGSALLGAVANTVILGLPAGSEGAIAARFVTGAALAGVYPVGMKLAVSWSNGRDTGFVVSLLVGGLTLGSASPHLVNALGGLDWRLTLGAASLSAMVAAGLIGLTKLGPNHPPAQGFRPGAALDLWRNRHTRLVTFGYLGHMWELYAMWAWVGLYLAASFATWRGGGAVDVREAALATFCVIAVGALGCVAAGKLADQIGRVPVTVGAMAISGTCCLLAGAVFGAHPAVTIGLCLVWGVAVVADSAQFSAAVAAYSAPGLIGTMLTVQNCAGFALTLVTIHLTPVLIAAAGWGGAFATLALGPMLGCVAMLRVTAHAGRKAA